MAQLLHPKLCWVLPLGLLLRQQGEQKGWLAKWRGLHLQWGQAASCARRGQSSWPARKSRRHSSCHGQGGQRQVEPMYPDPPLTKSLRVLALPLPLPLRERGRRGLVPWHVPSRQVRAPQWAGTPGTPISPGVVLWHVPEESMMAHS